jgi:hypothetical protein
LHFKQRCLQRPIAPAGVGDRSLSIQSLKRERGGLAASVPTKHFSFATKRYLFAQWSANIIRQIVMVYAARRASDADFRGIQRLKTQRR